MGKLVNRQHIFPKGKVPKILVKKLKVPRPRFNRDEEAAIEKIKQEYLLQREGDPTRLSVQRVIAESDSRLIIEVGEIKYSEIKGVQNRTPSGVQRLKELGIRPLISKNFIITKEGFLLYSIRDRLYRTSLNGYVDSDSVVGLKDDEVIVRTVMNELKEEYALEGDKMMVSIHSVHLRGIPAFPHSVNIFGTVDLPFSLMEVLDAQRVAIDIQENPILRVIENNLASIRSFIAQGGEDIGKLLRIYAKRMLYE
ncbi:hypothetical protein HY988_01515 [Candidatus Micrarchaeota archaeon]|nr:hypothetical protein [Candidatus Micrarchaeota archaeon]